MRAADFYELHPEPEFTSESVQRLYDALDADEEPALPVLVDFTAALLAAVPFVEDDNNWLMSEPEPDHLSVYLTASWESIPRSTADVLRLAGERGLLVFDPQNLRVYDLTGAIPLHTVTWDDLDSAFLSAPLLHSLVDRAKAQQGWVILDREDEVYAQSRFREDGWFEVEHRAGSVKRHFQFLTTDASLVERTLWQWATGDKGWRKAGAWQKIDLS